MASSGSSTSFRSSSYTSSFAADSSSPLQFDNLPVMKMKKKIVEKIMENRVTLIVGETGCGKSSQIPQFLLEENMGPILCTQPRRFAVVTVASTVAKQRHGEVGNEVGYHIGHLKVFSARSKIIFKTAGVLLDEMRDRGYHALDYKVVILDEVHERSIESDLVLLYVKQFLLKKKDLRVVLMSATADIGRYRDYFNNIETEERVEVLAIPPSTDQNAIFQRKVLYLEQITDLLGVQSEDLSMEYCSGLSPREADANMKEEVHKLIHALVMHIHKSEPDIEKSIMVFLPTYYTLEQQWVLLKPLSVFFNVHILHSSIEIERALKAMAISEKKRKVILATNIAESSVTIPKVGYVIDSCRTLQVNWDSCRKVDSAQLEWVSKSQADQRKGRTGRNCEGEVYRLVTGQFFSQLEEYEPPSIRNLSLRQQVLQICCAEFKHINDPILLLQKAMDPPEPEVVHSALDLLLHIGALKKVSTRSHYEPTFYGRLLASFSLTFDASFLILKFGELGMLRDGIILAIMMDMQTLPILRPFGREPLLLEYIADYYSGDGNKTGLTGKKELMCISNYFAYLFWNRVHKDQIRLERMKGLLNFNGGNEIWEAQLPKREEDWCSLHNLVHSALQQAEEMYDEIVSSLHRYRPNYLVECDGLLSYEDHEQFNHRCYVNRKPNHYNRRRMHDHDKSNCFGTPFLASNNYEADEIAKKFVYVVKEIRMVNAEEVSENIPPNKGDTYGNDDASQDAPICIYYLSGSCNRGNECRYSHSSTGRKPSCNFFFSLQGCRNGNSCSYSHEADPSVFGGNYANDCRPQEEDADIASLLGLFPLATDEYVLILDDTNFNFSLYLTPLYDPSRMIVTTSRDYCSDDKASLEGFQILWGLSHPYQTLLSGAGVSKDSWKKMKCVLWFLKISDENSEGHKSLIQTFFQYLAVRIIADSHKDVQVILTMNNLRFCQLQVEKLAREAFFILNESFPFDEQCLGEPFSKVITSKPMVVSRAISYIFKLRPPENHSSGHYADFFRFKLRQLEREELSRRPRRMTNR